MAVIGTLVAKLNMDSSGFSRGSQKAQGSMGKLAKSAAKMGAAVVASFGAAGVAAVGFGIKLVAEAEQAKVAFTTMLGSAEAATKMLSDLKKFAASTPFQLGDLRQAARQLLAFGFASEDIMKHMKTMGDLAAGTQKPIADFVDIFGKVKASGIAALGDINRLADRGVPIYAALAKQMGVSEGEIRGLASSGKIGLNEIQGALENVVGAGGLFENSMMKQSKTLSGLWSTLKDNVLFVIEDIATELSSGFDLKSILTSGIETVQKVGQAIVQLAPLIRETGALVRTLAVDFGHLVTPVAAIFKGLGKVFGLVSDNKNAFKGFVDDLLNAVIALDVMLNNIQKILLAITNDPQKKAELALEIGMRAMNARNRFPKIADPEKKEAAKPPTAEAPTSYGFNTALNAMDFNSIFGNMAQAMSSNVLGSAFEGIEELGKSSKEAASSRGDLSAKEKGSASAFSAILGAKDKAEKMIAKNTEKSVALAEQQIERLDAIIEMGGDSSTPIVMLGGGI